MQEKLKKAQKKAEKAEPLIAGWDVDHQAGIMWAEYQPDSLMGRIIGIKLSTSMIEYR